ncbi:TonB-dependent siderophore receptor [Ferrimonas sp. SCSIO 43195]|uniref:TonB-dependent siderophore receptor n=1 Tax=Ferrimonas sp. SCSIO 43195 TaxID=2822844 RepID=UPI002075FD25|nr:TonB-dependent siderophore receptor [Ferrimonas sp. SCSIO 43195]USD39532.1 TonB-dependent siderophore receptor [Ferrimonas sp. SCSIO 43195]
MNGNHPGRRALVCAALLPVIHQASWPTSAWASQEEQGREIEVIEVQGAAYRTTGTKSSLRPLESPMSFEVYDRALLDRRQVDSVNEALRYVPGVTAENRSSVTIFDQYTIRGFETYRNFYDGLPLQYNGLWNLAPQVDAFATESIEILKGPTSVLYGAAPPGGMVNQVAKKPQADAMTELRGRVGSNDLYELALDSTGALTDGLNGRLIALYRDRDGQQETTREERRFIAPSIAWEMGRHTSIELSAYYQDDPSIVPSTPLPALGTVYSASYGKLDSDAYAGDANWNRFDRQVLMLGYKLNHQFSDSLEFLQNFRYTDADAGQRNMYNYGLADQQNLIRSAYFTDESIEGYVVDNQLAWLTSLGSSEHRWLLGVEYSSLDSDVAYGDTLGQQTPMLDLASPNYHLIDPASLPVDFYQQANVIEQTQLGIYLQDEVRFDALTLVVGARWDRYESTDTADNNYAGTEYGSVTEIDQDELSARAAAIYTFDSGWAPYLSYSESFEPVSGVDSNTGAAFKPTTASQWEIGVKYHNADLASTLTVAAFDIRKKNVVVNTPDFGKYTQNGEVQSRGVELALSQRLLDNLELTLNYGYLDAEVTDNPLDPAIEGTTPVWVADQTASAWLDYYPLEAMQVSAGVRYVGETQLDAANTDTVPAYTLWDMAASYQLGEQWSLSLSASNLFDKRYVGACFDGNNCWMGAERSIEASASFWF